LFKYATKNRNIFSDEKFITWRDFVATVGSPKGFIFITAGQRPAGRKDGRENCLKGRTVNYILNPAFQTAETDAASLYRGSATHGYENKALRASDRCNKIIISYELADANKLITHNL
jgi:hypothetical protein